MALEGHTEHRSSQSDENESRTREEKREVERQTLPYRSQVQATCGVVLVPGANPAWGETRNGLFAAATEVDGGGGKLQLP